MSGFEFLLGLFGLLAGLSLAEIFGGVARSVEVRKNIRIGTLTPLMATLMIIDIVAFWVASWDLRDALVVGSPLILAVTVFAGVYYVGAYLVFPRTAEPGTDLDEHFLDVRALVLGAMLIANLCQLAITVAWEGASPRSLWFAASALPLLILLLVSMFASSRRVTQACLFGAVGYYLWSLLGYLLVAAVHD